MSVWSRYRGLVDPLRSERRVEAAVLVLLVLLCLQLLWGAYRAALPGMPEPVLPTADALTVQSLRAVDGLTPEMRAEIRQRPLFWAARTPSASIAQQDAAIAQQALANSEPAEIKGLKLAGVFGTGESAGIIVLATKKNTKHRVRVDQEVGGWTLQSVNATEAVLSRDGRQATLALQRGNILVTDTAPAPQPAAVTKKAKAPAEQAAAPERRKKPAKNQNGSRAAKPNADDDSLSLGRGSR
jgi:hypothetical protein